MPTPTDNYNIKDLKLIIGTKSIENFFEDSEVSLEKRNDDNEPTEGLDGSVVNNESNSVLYDLTFSVMPNSEDNKYLRGLKASGGLFPCYYDDEHSGERVSMTGCKFVKPATKVGGKKIGERAWAIYGSGQELT